MRVATRASQWLVKARKMVAFGAGECAAAPDCVVVDPYARDNTSALCGVERAYGSATFCIQPGGDTPYRKGLYDAILMGCIPVVFGRHNTEVAPWFVPEGAMVRFPTRAYVRGDFRVMDRLRAR